MFTEIIYISQTYFLMIIYIYTLWVFVYSIAIVWPTGQQKCHMFTHFFAEINAFSYDFRVMWPTGQHCVNS